MGVLKWRLWTGIVLDLVTNIIHNIKQTTMQDRIRFFSKEDLSLSYYMSMAEGVVDEYSNGRHPSDINDYLEMYEITMFVENGIYSDKWDEKKRKEILGYSSSIAKYLSSLTSASLPSVYSSLTEITSVH